MLVDRIRFDLMRWVLPVSCPLLGYMLSFRGGICRWAVASDAACCGGSNTLTAVELVRFSVVFPGFQSVSRPRSSSSPFSTSERDRLILQHSSVYRKVCFEEVSSVLDVGSDPSEGTLTRLQSF